MFSRFLEAWYPALASAQVPVRGALYFASNLPRDEALPSKHWYTLSLLALKPSQRRLVQDQCNGCALAVALALASESTGPLLMLYRRRPLRVRTLASAMTASHVLR